MNYFNEFGAELILEKESMLHGNYPHSIFMVDVVCWGETTWGNK